jgi:hypothetical protein
MKDAHLRREVPVCAWTSTRRATPKPIALSGSGSNVLFIFCADCA